MKNTLLLQVKLANGKWHTYKRIVKAEDERWSGLMISMVKPEIRSKFVNTKPKAKVSNGQEMY